ncbi:unnamed protein product, partial [Ectocarpus sp. 12 AP-2014]
RRERSHPLQPLLAPLQQPRSHRVPQDGEVYGRCRGISPPCLPPPLPFATATQLGRRRPQQPHAAASCHDNLASRHRRLPRHSTAYSRVHDLPWLPHAPAEPSVTRTTARVWPYIAHQFEYRVAEILHDPRTHLAARHGLILLICKPVFTQ